MIFSFQLISQAYRHEFFNIHNWFCVKIVEKVASSYLCSKFRKKDIFSTLSPSPFFHKGPIGPDKMKLKKNATLIRSGMMRCDKIVEQHMGLLLSQATQVTFSLSCCDFSHFDVTEGNE